DRTVTGVQTCALPIFVGIGATTFWARRDHPLVRVLLGFVIAVTALWGYVLLHRTPAWFPMLRSGLLVCGLGVALFVAISPTLRGRVGVVVAIATVMLGLAAPAAYTLSTVAQAHSRALPTAGPANAAGGRRRFR